MPIYYIHNVPLISLLYVLRFSVKRVLIIESHLPEYDVSAVNDKVERRVDDHEQVIRRNHVGCPSWKSRAFSIQQIEHLVERDENLPDVANDEKHDNADEHKGYASISPTSRGLLFIREKAAESTIKR